MIVETPKYFYLRDRSFEHPHEIVAEGCVLPDGQVALAWRGGRKTHGCYPTFSAFKSIQDRQPSREISFVEVSMDGFHLNTFRLVRKEDISGISGTAECLRGKLPPETLLGLVAVGCQLWGANIVVLQWVTATPSIFWYPNLNAVEQLHGHGGKTAIEEDRIWGDPSKCLNRRQ